jgi:Ca-activated chloride channel family protein
VKNSLLSVLLLSSVLFLNGGRRISAQDDSRILVNVVLVQLNVAVTDRKGNYISGLKP